MGPISLLEIDDGDATPTLAPLRPTEVQSGAQNNGPTTIVTVTPPPTISVADCQTNSIAANNGFLDLPFPYSGSADEFRRISQRSRFWGAHQQLL